MVVSRRFVLAVLGLTTLTLCGCGGGSGGGGGGGGGGRPTIASVSPSTMMVNVPLGLLLVSRSNFTSDALVAIDGELVPSFRLDPNTVEAEVSPSFDSTVVTHQITLQQSTGTSNAVSMTVYAPQQGPFVSIAETADVKPVPRALYSTPPARPLAQVAEERRDSLEHEVLAKWQDFVENGALVLHGSVVVATARN